MMMALISRGAFALSLFGLVTAGSVALTYQATDEQIARNQKAIAVAALSEVLPAHDNDLLGSQVELPPAQALGQTENWEMTPAIQRGELVAYAVPVRANDGYSGPIDMILAINMDGSVNGLRVVAHRETPGLGDKIDLAKSDWILDFNGKSLTNPASDGWAPTPDGGQFDAFTGATITPRAVIEATARALAWHERTGRSQVMEAVNAN